MLPKPLGQHYILRAASADEFLSALQAAIRKDNAWHGALRKGKKPSLWELSAGSAKLKELGNTLLGERDADTGSEDAEASSTQTPAEQAILIVLRRSVTHRRKSSRPWPKRLPKTAWH